MKTIFSGDGIEFRVRCFAGNDKTMVTPGSLQWRLECDTTGAVLQDWTTVATETINGDVSALIEVDGALNVTRGAATETKRLLVSADRGQPRQASEELRYNVKGLAR